MAKIQWERKHQEWVVCWFKLQYPQLLIVASANGGSRNKIEAVNLKRSGVLAGVPDLQIFEARKGFHGLLIEMKDPGSSERPKGKVSTVQKGVIAALNHAGYHAVVCWGFDAAKDLIKWYLEE